MGSFFHGTVSKGCGARLLETIPEVCETEGEIEETDVSPIPSWCAANFCSAGTGSSSEEQFGPNDCILARFVSTPEPSTVGEWPAERSGRAVASQEVAQGSSAPWPAPVSRRCAPMSLSLACESYGPQIG